MTRSHRGVVLATLVPSLLLGACLEGAPGCTESEVEEFHRVEHYRGRVLEPQLHESGACHATFETSDLPDAVLDAYRAEVQAAGYVIRDNDITPILDEAGEVEGRIVRLVAENDRFQLSIAAFVSGEDEPTYEVFVDDLDPPR